MMDEPERMLDQTNSTLERALLREGRAYQGSDDLRPKTLAALGLAGSAGIVGGLLTWLSSKSLTTKIVLTLSTATLLVALPVGLVLRGRGGLTPAPSPTAPVVARPSAPGSPSSPAPPGQTPPETLAAPGLVPTQPAAPSAPSPRAMASTGSALRAELAALDAVRSTLANDDPTGALSFLEAYFHTFPRGRLQLEAEVLRIDALAKAGRSDEAKRNAQAFLKRHPNSVLAARVRPYAER
jgi:hypothetical protein